MGRDGESTTSGGQQKASRVVEIGAGVDDPRSERSEREGGCIIVGVIEIGPVDNSQQHSVVDHHRGVHVLVGEQPP